MKSLSLLALLAGAAAAIAPSHIEDELRSLNGGMYAYHSGRPHA
jgi:hypothetical protein